MSDSTPRTLILVAALLATAAGVRLLFLLNPHVDADIAVVGLMGLHMLDGEFSPLYWGQDYGGSLEAVVAAGFFALFGADDHTLNMAPAFISLFYLLGLFYLVRELMGRRAGLLALLLSALGPFYLIWYSVQARAINIEVLTLGTWLLFLAAKALKEPSGRPLNWRLYLGIGLLGGVGVWCHLLMAYFLVPAGLMLWRREPRLPLRPGFLLILAGLLTGSLPLWWYNLTHHWAAFSFFFESRAQAGFGESLAYVFDTALPVLVGARYPGSGGGWFLPGAGPLLLVLSALAGAFALAGWGRALWAWPRRRKGGGLGLCLLVFICLVFFFSLMGGAVAHSQRYLLAFYAIWPLALVYAFVRLQGGGAAPWRRWLAWAGILFFAAANLYGSLDTSLIFDAQARARRAGEKERDARVIEFLESRGIKYAYMTDYWMGPPATFQAREKVIFVLPHRDRQPEYFWGLMRSAQAAALVAHGKDARLMPNLLHSLAASYQEQPVSAFHVFWDIRPPATHPVAISARGFSARADDQAAASLAWDRNAATRWSSQGPQRPGQEFVLDLGRVVEGVCQLLLFSGRVEDKPVDLDVRVSVDGENWQKVAQTGETPFPAFWSGGKPVTNYDLPWQEIRFSPRAARYIRLEQEENLHYWWSLVELVVGAQSGTPDDAPDWEMAADWIEGLLPGQTELWCEPALNARLPERLRPRPGRGARPAWLRDFMDPAYLLTPDQGHVFAVRQALAGPALAALEAAGWQAEVENEHGVALIQARPPEGGDQPAWLYWSGLLPLAARP